MATSAEPLEGLDRTVSTTCNSPYTCLHQTQKKFHHQVKIWICRVLLSLRKQSTFCNRGGGGGGLLTSGFPRKRHLRNDCRNSILMMNHLDLGSASDWLCCLGILLQPVRSATQICTVTCLQYGISALVFQTPPWIVLFVFKVMSIISTLCCTI